MKLQIAIALTIILTSCSEKRIDKIQYKDGNQILNANEINRYGEKIPIVQLNSIVPDTVKVGDRFYAKVFLSDPTYKVVDARFDCNVTDESMADTTMSKIVGCSKGLLIKEDTIRIYFIVGGEAGSRDFSEISILSKDNDNIYRYHKGSFHYVVKE